MKRFGISFAVIAAFVLLAAQIQNPGIQLIGSFTPGNLPQINTRFTVQDSGASATGSAFTRTDDTNVTAILTGSPATALLRPMNFALGWTGTLAAGRLNSNVVQSVVNDTNVTGSIATQALTLGWTGNLAIARGGTGAGTQQAAFDALAPTCVVAGCVIYWNGTNYVKLDGNTSGTNFLSENGSGAPAWASAVTSATIAGTSNVIAVSGTCTITTTGTCTLDLAAARKTLPTRQVFLSGSGTYTTPANVLWIEVELCGGGGGSSGSGTAGGGNGGNGGNTTFGTGLLTGNGGAGGTSSAGAGGTATGGDYSVTGGSGQSGFTQPAGQRLFGGYGGGSYYLSGGIPGPPGTNGPNAPDNSCIGAGGAGAETGIVSGSGGGGGGWLNKIIGSPAASYPYAVGAGGTAGTAGTSGQTGGVGGSGRIIVTEHYGS